MSNSILLAQILGPYLIIVGIGIFFNLKHCQQIAHEYTQSSALMYFGGIMALFFGLIIITMHNVWSGSWTLIITLFGWIGLIKGAALIIIPDYMKKIALSYVENIQRAKIQSVIVFVIGLILFLKGYCS